MRQAGKVFAGGRRRFERIQHQAVQHLLARRGDRFEHGLPRQLVPEAERIILRFEHSHRHAFIRGLRFRSGYRCQQLRPDALADDRRRFQNGPPGRAEPRRTRQNGVANGGWNPAARPGQHFSDVKRVAPGLAVESASVDLLVAHQGLHRLTGQRLELDAPHRR